MFATALIIVALAQAPDPSSLYDMSTDGSTASVKAGEKGKLVLEIRTKDGSHVSEEAPMKIELSGKGVALEKQQLTLSDAVTKTPRFEVPFSTKEKGKSQVDAKLTFFICTEKVCARQQKTLTVAVDVI